MNVAVVGAGTMGRGIAQLLAERGCAVTLVDADPEVAYAGVEAIGVALDRAVSRGRIDSQLAEDSIERVRPAEDVADACREALMAIEAVPERLELKQQVLSDVASELAPGATLATNTSSLSIDALGRWLPDPTQLIGLHFFNPPVAMQLVEVVRGPRTSSRHVDRALGLIEQLGKEAVVIRDSPGFATSRLGVLMGLEAARMVEEGVADPEDIDRAMEIGYGHPMGPLRLSDLIGVDVRVDIAQNLERELGPRFAPPKLMLQMVEDGQLGRKSGQGFHRWA